LTRGSWRHFLAAGAAGLGLAFSAVAQVPAAAGKSIYSCVDERGRRITSDRPIAECLGKEQRILNADGSVKDIRPPSLSPQERVDQERREQAQTQARLAQVERTRRDRSLLVRYPDEASHQRARDSALEVVRKAQAITEGRLMDLDRERAPLLAEAEFYQGKPFPVRLKAAIDANDAARAAQSDAAAGQASEVERINRLFDAELARLRRLWAGATAGQVGQEPPANPPAKASAAPRKP
jgi:hypothetical protein